MIAKTTGNNKKPTKHYREKKLGLIDRLSIALLKKQDTLVKIQSILPCRISEDSSGI